MFINSGDKNVNMVDIINKSKDIVKPTNNGKDDYGPAEEPFVMPKRDPREHIPLNVINGDETKPTDSMSLEDKVAYLMNELAKATAPASAVTLVTSSGRSFDVSVDDEGNVKAERCGASCCATVTNLTEGLNLDDTDLYNLKITGMRPVALNWVAANPSIGRMYDGWWLKMRVVAPASLTAEEDFEGVTYTTNSSSTPKNFWEKKDSKDTDTVHYLNCWFGVSEEKYNSAIENGTSVHWEYVFNWPEAVQTITIDVDPNTLTLNKGE